jgi:membrane fusion protein, multidrug efflux system
LREQAKVLLAKLGGDPNFTVSKHPAYEQAKAQVDEAQRQVDHTVVRAPFNGIVTQVDQRQPGVYLVASTAALTNTGAVALVATDDIWIEANFKETVLTWVKPGDSVEISVDSYPDRSWTGKVKSIAPASGALSFRFYRPRIPAATGLRSSSEFPRSSANRAVHRCARA